MFYYCVLLVIGNDIMPATRKEVFVCSAVIFFGAFLEAYIIGGITAEQIKKDDKTFQNAKNYDYLNYSMDIHNFPD